MAIKLSTGMRNALLDSGSVKGSLDGGKIMIYSGTAPANPDDPPGGTLLCTITLDGGGVSGINFAASASSGTLQKASGETWSGSIGNTGDASFYRHVAWGDTEAFSTTDVRIQGSIDVVGADMNLSNVTLTNGGTQVIDYYVVNMPAS